jgi:hypothetical protein
MQHPHVLSVTDLCCLQHVCCFCVAFVDVLQALVINAPAWFSYPWKLMNAFLDANTRCGAAAATASVPCLIVEDSV